MNILFSTGSITHLPIDEIFNLSKEAGFDGCELVIDSRFKDPRYIDKVLKYLHIMPVFSVHAPYMKIKTWGNQIDALKRTVQIAQVIGAEHVIFHPPSWFYLEFGFFRWFIGVKDFQNQVGKNQVRLSIENMPLMGNRLIIPPYFLNDYRKLINYGVTKNLFFTYDTTHIATFGHDPVSVFIEYFRTGRLVNIHISDFRISKSHLLINRGDLPLIKLLNTAMRLGYDGNMTLEVAPYELPKTRAWIIKIMKYQCSLIELHARGGID